MLAGILGSVLPCAAAAASALAALNVKVATPCEMAAYVMVDDATLDGTLPAFGAEKPAICSASALLAPICGVGSLDHAKVPYVLRSGSDCRSATLTGTGLTWVGAKTCERLTDAVATTARTTANATTAIGRCADRLITGNRKPKRGDFAGAAVIRL